MESKAKCREAAASFLSLPDELKIYIVQMLDPGCRRQMRQVNRHMTAVVAQSMADVKSVEVIHNDLLLKQNQAGRSVLEGDQLDNTSRESSTTEAVLSLVRHLSTDTNELKSSQSVSPHGQISVCLVSTDPFTGTDRANLYVMKSRSLPFLLIWAAIRASRLKVTATNCSSDEKNKWLTLRRIFGVLISVNAMPRLMHLEIKSCLIVKGFSILEDILSYVTFRQQMAAPFLHSLVLQTGLNNCCSKMTEPDPLFRSRRRGIFGFYERLRRMVVAEDSVEDEYLMGKKDEYLEDEIGHLEEMTSMKRFAKSKTVQTKGRKAATPLRFKENGSPVDDEPNPDPPIYISPDQCRHLLQLILDQSDGLRKLSMDSVLSGKRLRLDSLHYPSSLHELATDRLGLKGGEMGVVLARCPRLRVVRLTRAGFARLPADILALLNLSELEELEIVTGDKTVGEDDLFRLTEQMDGRRGIWPQLRSVKLNRVSATFFSRLALSSPNIQQVEMRIERASRDDRRHAALGPSILLPVVQLNSLRRLIIEDLNEGRTAVLTDSFLDCLSRGCTNLEYLCVRPSNIDMLSMPTLLKKCSKLRLVALKELSVNLGELDGLIMIRAIADDLLDRESSVVIEVKELANCNYDEVGRINDGLKPGTCMVLSCMADTCVHNRLQCNKCRFSKHLPPSLILALRDRPNASVVFIADKPPPKSLRYE